MKCYKVFSFTRLYVWLILPVLPGLLTHCGPNDEDTSLTFYKGVDALTDQDSLYELLATDLLPEEAAIVCNQLAWELRRTPDSTLKYGNSALGLAQASNYPRAEADAHNRMGLAYQKQGYIDSAIFHYQSALAIEEALENMEGVARSYNQLGEALVKRENYASAIIYYQKAVFAFKAVENYNNAHRALNNMAEAARREASSDSTVLSSLKQAVALNQDYKTDSARLAVTYLELGRYYVKVQRNDTALEHLKKALRLYKKPSLQANVYLELGGVALKEEEYQLAIQRFKKILQLDVSKQKESYRGATYNLGVAYKELGNYNAAWAYFSNSKELSIKYKDSLRLGLALNSLGVTAYKGLFYDSAAQFYQQSLTILDAIDSEQTIHPIFNLALLYEITGNDSLALFYRKYYEIGYQAAIKAQQEAEIARRKVEKAEALMVQEYENRQRINRLIILLGLVLLLLLLGVVLAWNYRRSARLAKREAVVLRQETDLAQAQAKIQGEEQTKKRIARDIHDDLGNILTLIRVHFEAVEKSINQQQRTQAHHYQEAFSLLGRAVDFSRNIAEELDPVTLRSFGLIPALKDIQNSLHGVNGLQVQLIPIRMTERLPALVERMVFQLIQETVGNVVKHAGATSLTIQLVRHKNELSISIEDNGRGFDVEAVAQRKGRQGMGLANLRSRVDALGGTLTIDSRTADGADDQPSGTSVMIDLSLTQHLNKDE